MLTATDPMDMTPEDRRNEIAAILAAGFLRLSSTPWPTRLPPTAIWRGRPPQEPPVVGHSHHETRAARDVTMFDWLRRKPAAAPDRLSNRHVLVRPARVVRGRYDAAQTTSDNERHWANADFLATDTVPVGAGAKPAAESAKDAKATPAAAGGQA